MALSQVLNLYKEKGETPLARVERFRLANPEYQEVKMTYAGRLDPMAEGVLIVLCGDEIKNKQNILDYNKQYEVKILFGFSTDTHDLLGLVQGISDELIDVEKELSDEKMTKFIGKFKQKYPLFSSKTYLGKPLFEHTLENIDIDIIPSKDVEIFSISNKGFSYIKKEELRDYIKNAVSIVNGDFRQNKIIAVWNEMLDKTNCEVFPILKMVVECSSGTYMRSLAERIGREILVPSLAMSIKRVSVGEYGIANSAK